MMRLRIVTSIEDLLAIESRELPRMCSFFSCFLEYSALERTDSTSFISLELHQGTKKKLHNKDLTPYNGSEANQLSS